MTVFKTLKRRLKAMNPMNKREGVTFFEVKTLYNQAYEHKAQARKALKQYRMIEAKAKILDAQYRAQLAKPYRSAAA